MKISGRILQGGSRIYAIRKQICFFFRYILDQLSNLYLLKVSIKTVTIIHLKNLDGFHTSVLKVTFLTHKYTVPVIFDQGVRGGVTPFFLWQWRHHWRDILGSKSNRVFVSTMLKCKLQLICIQTNGDVLGLNAFFFSRTLNASLAPPCFCSAQFGNEMQRWAFFFSPPSVTLMILHISSFLMLKLLWILLHIESRRFVVSLFLGKYCWFFLFFFKALNCGRLMSISGCHLHLDLKVTLFSGRQP